MGRSVISDASTNRQVYFYTIKILRSINKAHIRDSFKMCDGVHADALVCISEYF